MQKPTNQKSIIYGNLQLLKGTYRLEPPPSIPWITLGNEFKLQQNTNIDTSSNQPTFSEQFSLNAFSKTKQLFKKKETASIIFDDLPNPDISPNQIKQNSPKNYKIPENHFQFDSFGRNQCIMLEPMNFKDKNSQYFSNDDVKTWNSESLEINFNKVQEQQLKFSEDIPQKIQLQNQKIETDSMSSIKQFCFNLNEVDIPILQRTPIKKWKDCKRKTDRIYTQQQVEKTQNKKQLQSVLKEFIGCIQNLNSDEINNSFLIETKTLLTKLKEKQSKSIGKRLFTRDTEDNIGSDESESTLTAKTRKEMMNCSYEKTKRKENKAPMSCEKQSKFKLYDKNQSKCLKDIKNVSKTDLKQKVKERRFKF